MPCPPLHPASYMSPPPQNVPSWYGFNCLVPYKEPKPVTLDCKKVPFITKCNKTPASCITECNKALAPCITVCNKAPAPYYTECNKAPAPYYTQV